MKTFSSTHHIIFFAYILSIFILTYGGLQKSQYSLRTIDEISPKNNKQLLVIPIEKSNHQPSKSQNIVEFLKMGQKTISQKLLTRGAINFLQQLSNGSNSSQLKNGLYQIPLTNYLDTQYSGYIAVGNPNNKLKMIFDTGSTLLWVNSVRCKEDECIEHPKYNYKSSDHWEPVMQDKLYSTSFGSGILNGVLSQDWVYLDDLIIKNYKFAEIINQDTILKDANFDGVMGLSFAEKNHEYGLLQSIIDQIKQENLLAKNMFSFYLKRESGLTDSKIMFGGYDESLLGSPITWSNVVGDDYWMVKGDNILIDGQDIGLCLSDCYFIMDTGTSVLTGPAFGLDILLDAIEVDDGCQNYYDLPQITFVIEGKHFNLDPNDYILAIGKQKSFLPYERPNLNEISDCVSVFYPLDLPLEENGNIWILGDTFLSKFYAIFDRDDMKIGIALQK